MDQFTIGTAIFAGFVLWAISFIVALFIVADAIDRSNALFKQMSDNLSELSENRKEFTKLWRVRQIERGLQAEHGFKKVKLPSITYPGGGAGGASR